MVAGHDGLTMIGSGCVVKSLPVTTDLGPPHAVWAHERAHARAQHCPFELLYSCLGLGTPTEPAPCVRTEARTAVMTAAGALSRPLRMDDAWSTELYPLLRVAAASKEAKCLLPFTHLRGRQRRERCLQSSVDVVLRDARRML